jgi:hydrogenase maturation protein HypF
MMELDFSPLVGEIVERVERGWPVEELAAMFHDQLARGWDAMVGEAAQRTGIGMVALSGGVFCNQRFTEALSFLLARRGLRVLRHRLVPPNDGGLSFGQAAAAAAIFRAHTGSEGGASCV